MFYESIVGRLLWNESVLVGCWHSDLISILDPFIIDIGEEGTFPSLNVGLNNAIEIGSVTRIGNLLTTIALADLLEIRLKLQSSWQLVVQNDLTTPHHFFVHLGVAIKEGLGCIEVTNGFVDVQFVQKFIKSSESLTSDLISGNF